MSRTSPWDLHFKLIQGKSYLKAEAQVEGPSVPPHQSPQHAILDLSQLGDP